MIVLCCLAFPLQKADAQYIASDLQPSKTDINRIKAADVLYSYDDIFYEDRWEARENYVHTVLYYNNSFWLDHTYSLDATMTADKNAGLTRTRTYHVYGID